MKALISLSCIGLIALLAEIFSFKKLLYPLVLIGLIVTFALNAMDWNTNVLYYNMMRYDNFAVAFVGVLVFIAFLWFIMAHDFFTDESNQADHHALIMFSLVGALVMSSYTNMSMLFLGIEILSIPMYILCGSRKQDVLSNESAFKYLITGAFATGFLLFGIALIYGATGTFDVPEMMAIMKQSQSISSMFYMGVLLMFVGLGFKVSAVPFHFWAPDVYQGAPTVITAFMSTIVKTAAFAALLRLVNTSFVSVYSTWGNIIVAMAILTLLVGNITAAVQTNTKRLMAYSSIAHAGYMLLAIVACNNYSNGAILLYTLSYSLGSIATFCIIYILDRQKNSQQISAFNGLGKTNPMLAFVMAVALLSLAGIPPTAGFFAKYYIFTSAFSAGHGKLVLIAIIASLIGIYYYFKIIIAMYFHEPANHHEEIRVNTNHKLVLIAITIAILLVGILPNAIIRLL